ncbi:Nucleoside-diphosphate-sugar epimerase [Solitalea koreensis]|uniref:Nucleoside-diphosphate-sugar epimerase n=2 Tax=Solitalea koreensis TaxID=543615 RepID=A0A521BYI7_9SPHI|nr:Nucleoside-diphosphate-sugar epimerase [Solitalea koreensis]
MILVTGATGFLGSQLVFDLVSSGKMVRALKRSSSKIPQCLANLSGIEWVNGDVLDYYSLEDALKGIRQVYHCAAKVTLNSKFKGELYRTNIEGTANLVNACLAASVEKLVHASSIAAIGIGKPGELITENHKFEYSPVNSAYAISKYESENEVWRGMAEGLNAVIVNPTIIIGKENWTEGSGRLFGKVRDGLNVYPLGGCGFVDVRDVSKSMIMLMESTIANERFIVNSENLPYKQLFDLIADELGKTKPKIAIRKWHLELGWRIAKLFSFLNGKDPALTRDTASSAPVLQYYDANKLSAVIPFNPISIDKSIKEICARKNRS